jgi:hypothetical protein
MSHAHNPREAYFNQVDDRIAQVSDLHAYQNNPQLVTEKVLIGLLHSQQHAGLSQRKSENVEFWILVGSYRSEWGTCAASSTGRMD